MLLLVRRDR